MDILLSDGLRICSDPALLLLLEGQSLGPAETYPPVASILWVLTLSLQSAN